MKKILTTKNTKNKPLWGQHSFLFKLVSTFLTAALLPLFLFGWLFINNSYEEMISQNEKYYNSMAASMCRSFQDQVNDMRATVAKLDYEKQISRSEVEIRPYNFVIAVEEMENYNTRVSSSQEMCLYFHNSNYVLSSKGKYGYEFFLTRFFNGDLERENQLRQLMNTPTAPYSILSSFDINDYRSAKSLFLIPVRNYATAIFIVDRLSFDTSFLGSFNQDTYGLMILDGAETLIYDSNGLYGNLSAAKGFAEYIRDPLCSAFAFTSADTEYRAYKSTDFTTSLNFLVLVPEEEIMQSRTQLYSHLGNVFLWTGGIFLLLFVIVVYVNYSPIFKVKKQLKESGRLPEPTLVRGELDSIGYALTQFQQENDTMSRTILEQTDAMTDFVLINLIDGRNISGEKLNEISITFGPPPFCIIAAKIRPLDFSERKMLTDNLKEQLGITVNIIRLLHENYTLLLCSGAIPTDGRRHFAVTLHNHLLQQTGDADCRIGVGVTVNNLSEIRTSYLGSLSALESASTLCVILYEELLNHPENSDDLFRDATMKFLQHIRQGEGVKAQEQLDIISTHILSHSSCMIERYLGFDLLGEYFKLLTKLDIHLTPDEKNSLINFNNSSELLHRLSFSAASVCSMIAQSKQDVRINFSQSIVEYVDSNFTDPSLSLVKLSDEFGTSIYSLSRIFKEQTGIGYKEYVTAKRIEFSKTLLLTTDATITEIAERSGFPDPSSFSRMFKNNIGVSPNKFRE